MGGEDIREENTESQESLSSCRQGLEEVVLANEVRGGLAGGTAFKASKRRCATEGMCGAFKTWLLLFGVWLR